WKSLASPAGGIEAFEFVAPAGYVLGTSVAGRGTVTDGDPSHVSFTAELANIKDLPSTVGQGFKVQLSTALFSSTRSTVFATYAAGLNAMVELEASAVRTAPLLEAWQMKTWATIRDAAFAQYNLQVSQLQTQRDQLYAQLTGKDTLTLRRLEREELLRLVMEW